MTARQILVVDDEPNMRRVLEIMLARRGHRTLSAGDGTEALAMIEREPVDLVISDLRMPGLNGIELLRRLRADGRDVPLIMITAQGTIETAVEAMRLGACDYLLRPFDVETLDLAMSRVFAQREVFQRADYLRGEVARRWKGLVGDSAAMQRVRQQIAQVGPTRASVLLTGETGTGKEVVARAIHEASDRHEQLFVAINCAAIPADILESELFGHEKGAFTGAIRERVGKFELANGGTIFLDEITEMPIALQSKLLRVLQESRVERVGGNRSLELDLRVIAATNRAPRQALSDGRLREDLYYRLNVFTLALPPLRERLDDLPALITHFAAQAGSAPRPLIAPQALDYLRLYHWPGNVRELGNMVERALILSGGAMLDVVHFPQEDAPVGTTAAAPGVDARPDAGAEGMDAAVAALESRMISDALTRAGGNKTRAAQLLKISERSIFYKIRKYGLRGESG